MIRPITCLAFLAACGSGLYLYQEKHQVQVLDQQIAQTAHQTDQLRQQARLLRAEWMRLNDPDRLRRLANQFLPNLQSVSPGQYASLANLDSRLPPVQLPPPPTPPANPSPTTGVPVAQASPAAPGTPIDTAASGARSSTALQIAQSGATTPVVLPPPPPPAQARPSAPARAADQAAGQSQVAAATQPVSDRHASPPHPPVVQPPVRAAHRHQPHLDAYARDRQVHEVRLAARSQPRDAVPRRWQHPELRRPVVAIATESVRTHPVSSPRPYIGSMLGMAHEQPTVPAPVPMLPSNLMNVGG